MTVWFQILMFLFGLILLVFGSNLFVDSAVSLAERLHLPEVLIGATIVSLGTTLPEVVFSTMSSAQGFSDMALGNALGSILCNTGLIAGFLLFLRPIRLQPSALRSLVSGAGFLSVSLLIYLLGGLLCGGISRGIGGLLLLILTLYLWRTAQGSLTSEDSAAQADPLVRTSSAFGFSDFIRFLLEVTVIYIGAEFLVTYGPLLARTFGIPDIVISLTLVALGTSLPELATSLISLKKQHSSLSLGNIIGADILNFVLVGGLSAVIRPLPFSASILRLELPFSALLLALLLLPSFLQRKAGRLQGCLLMAGYVLYLLLLQH